MTTTQIACCGQRVFAIAIARRTIVPDRIGSPEFITESLRHRETSWSDLTAPIC